MSGHFTKLNKRAKRAISVQSVRLVRKIQCFRQNSKARFVRINRKEIA